MERIRETFKGPLEIRGADEIYAIVVGPHSGQTALKAITNTGEEIFFSKSQPLFGPFSFEKMVVQPELFAGLSNTQFPDNDLADRWPRGEIMIYRGATKLPGIFDTNYYQPNLAAGMLTTFQFEDLRSNVYFSIEPTLQVAGAANVNGSDTWQLILAAADPVALVGSGTGPVQQNHETINSSLDDGTTFKIASSSSILGNLIRGNFTGVTSFPPTPITFSTR